VGGGEVFVYTNHEIRSGGLVLLGGTLRHSLEEEKDTLLRLERLGDRFFAAASQDESRWTYLETITLPWSNRLLVGVAAVNTSTQAFAPEFRRFKLFQCRKDLRVEAGEATTTGDAWPRTEG
jgi:hypothetical protein